MKKLIHLMNEFGAFFLPKTKFNFPLKLISSEMPIGINYNAGVSAQLKSAVMLAGLNSFGNTVVNETQKSRDHTENMLLKNPHVIKIKNGKKSLVAKLIDVNEDEILFHCGEEKMSLNFLDLDLCRLKPDFEKLMRVNK